MVVNAPTNDIELIKKLRDCDNKTLKSTGLKMMIHNCWYINQELATLYSFSQKLFNHSKSQLVQTLNCKTDSGSHLLQSLPTSFEDLQILFSFFITMIF